MKLLVFAHTPPPHHGQSYMVELMLAGFGGDWRGRAIAEQGVANPEEVQCYHVNARFSDHLEDIGTFRWSKALLLLRYCAEAIWCRFRYGVETFYYIPAPGKRAALYRDWLVMLLCRPFFRHMVHHWHGLGLGDWLKAEGSFFERWVTHRLLGQPALGVALAIPSMRDPLWFRSREVAIIANGIPDPFPAFETEVLPQRVARLAARRAGEAVTFQVLYLAHCTREKGLFDAIDGVVRLQAQLRASGSPIVARLMVAGEFPREDERQEFDRALAVPAVAEVVTYVGFVAAETKTRLLAESDCLCFPTFYHAEGLPVVIEEALAAGLPVVTTRWRGIPEILPPDHRTFVPLGDADAIAMQLAEVLRGGGGDFAKLRARFVECFATARYVNLLRTAFRDRFGSGQGVASR